jgi:hypothetical protein
MGFEVVTTLFEGEYHRGAAALINSLSVHGYRGEVWCGIRGERPPWFRSVDDTMQLQSGLSVRIVPIRTEMHLANYKPYLLDLVAKAVPSAKVLIYFDPDIVVKCEWSVIEDWCARGIAAVADQNWRMPESSPVRHSWVEWCQAHGLEILSEPSCRLGVFCNSGFVGVARELLGFVELWREIQELIVAAGFNDRDVFGSIGEKKPRVVRGGVASGIDSFLTLDQDAFNVALMAYAANVSLLGPEAMDFVPGGYVLSHATGRPKPWEHSGVVGAACGHPPAKSYRHFLEYASGELSAVSDFSVIRRRLGYRLSRVIGAIYRRDDY